MTSVHDVSVGGILLGICEMSINSEFGLKINKPKKLSNIFEYFFGEDQGRYLIEVEEKNISKINKILKENNIYSELLGIVQKDFIELNGEFKLNIKDLYKINNQWYHNY